MWQADEAAMRSALSRHDELLPKVIAEYEGRVFSAMGDGMAAAFGSASAAVSAALAAQGSLQAERWPTATPLRVRMGLHTGEVESRDGDYFGTVVNRTARLMAIGHGGQVLCSATTAELVGDAAFDQCAATGANMDPADTVEYARHHIELARRQAAKPDSGST